jgi:hypothetical protein
VNYYRRNEVANEAKDCSTLDIWYRSIVGLIDRGIGSGLTVHSATVVSLVRGSVFLFHPNHYFNPAYANYLDIFLHATDSFAGLMCACIPIMKSLTVRFARWLQRLRTLDAKLQQWATLPQSSRSSLKG